MKPLKHAAKLEIKAFVTVATVKREEPAAVYHALVFNYSQISQVWVNPFFFLQPVFRSSARHTSAQLRSLFAFMSNAFDVPPLLQTCDQKRYGWW